MRLSLLEQQNTEKAEFFYDLCDAVAISLGNDETYKDIKNYFKLRMLTPDEFERMERMNKHIFNADDPKDSKRAALALAALMGPGAVVM